MVKAQGRGKDGRYIIVIGISEENIALLRRSKPIYFDPAALKIPAGATIGAITIFWGKDDAELTQTLQRLIGPETEISIAPKGDTRPQ